MFLDQKIKTDEALVNIFMLVCVHIMSVVQNRFSFLKCCISEINMKLELMNNRREADEQKLRKSK